MTQKNAPMLQKQGKTGILPPQAVTPTGKHQSSEDQVIVVLQVDNTIYCVFGLIPTRDKPFFYAKNGQKKGKKSYFPHKLNT